jgi:hypothetical protein
MIDESLHEKPKATEGDSRSRDQFTGHHPAGRANPRERRGLPGVIADFGEDGGVVRFKFEVLRASRVVEDAEQFQFATTG